MGVGNFGGFYNLVECACVCTFPLNYCEAGNFATRKFSPILLPALIGKIFYRIYFLSYVELMITGKLNEM